MAMYDVHDRYRDLQIFVESDEEITQERAWEVVSGYYAHRTEKENEKLEARRRAERAGVLPVVPRQGQNEDFRAWQRRIQPVQDSRMEWDRGVGAQFKPMEFTDYVVQNTNWRLMEVKAVTARRHEREEVVREAVFDGQDADDGIGLLDPADE